MVRFSEMSRGKFAAVVIAAVLLVVGLVTVVRATGSVTGGLLTGLRKGPVVEPVKQAQVTSINNANFTYFVPATDDNWTFDTKTTAYDQQHGVVKYVVHLKYPVTDVTVSQQVMPNALKPRGSDKFKGFIKDLNVSSSQDVGAGTLYYFPALENGAPASGSDRVVFATDGILLFGQAGQVLHPDAWSKLLVAMRPH